MTERQFRLTTGMVLLGCLYIDWRAGCGLIITCLLLMGATDGEVRRLLAPRARRLTMSDDVGAADGDAVRIRLVADRMLYLLFAGILFVGTFLYPKLLWWLDWSVAFALLGAGISGVCPMVLLLRAGGFQ